MSSRRRSCRSEPSTERPWLLEIVMKSVVWLALTVADHWWGNK
ncbi:hypothetical protein [Actinomadura rugatobispora]|uniref:Uncharacterized protein n=1 Tax=Actinomadura rugatobispora TaxID=1994 RepID=A0ABW1AF14_9ACTN